MMLVYNFDPTSGEFLSSSPADESPLQPGVYLIPANATPLAPPTATTGTAPVFVNGSWSLVADHRGDTYWTADGVKQIMTNLGDFPQGSTQSEPPPSLDDLKATAAAAIDAACAAAITSGFKSSALVASYTYPSQQTDQFNLSANVMSSLLPGLASGWTTPQLCEDSTGAWAYRDHTAAQIQQVGSDAKAAIQASLIKKATLQAEIAAATTNAAVNAISWSA